MKKTFLIISLIINLSIFNNVFCADKITIKEKIEIIENETNTYGGENIDIEQRLKNAEKYVFDNEKTGDLNKRADNLFHILGLNENLNQATTHHPITKQKKDTSIAENNDFSQENQYNEKKIYTSDYNYYSSETKNKELSNIEKEFFGKTFENEDDKTRLERIQAMEKAQKTNKEYKINKFAKFASTGIQIGGIILLLLAMIL